MGSADVSHNKCQWFVSIVTIQQTFSISKYIGFPSMNGQMKKHDFSFIIDKLSLRPTRWKNKLLNKPRRIALASSVLTSIPCYVM